MPHKWFQVPANCEILVFYGIRSSFSDFNSPQYFVITYILSVTIDALFQDSFERTHMVYE
jgi:hypothetical protein